MRQKIRGVLQNAVITHQVKSEASVISEQVGGFFISMFLRRFVLFSDSDGRIRNLCGACLGELGAIDPARVGLRLRDGGGAADAVGSSGSHVSKRIPGLARMIQEGFDQPKQRRMKKLPMEDVCSARLGYWPD